jgi:hypothetical protein
VVGALPDGHSALMLVAARLRHIAATKWGKRRYLVMDALLNRNRKQLEDQARLPPKKCERLLTLPTTFCFVGS